MKLFEELDSNKDGKISRDELAHAVEGVKSGHLLKNFERQEITYSEFKDLLMSMFKEESSIDNWVIIISREYFIFLITYLYSHLLSPYTQFH